MRAVCYALFLRSKGDFTENLWLINGFASSCFEYFGTTRYLFKKRLLRAKNFISLLARQAFSNFILEPYLSLFVHYLELYTNEADCKQ